MRLENYIFENMQYIVRYPDSFEEGKKYPVILQLHGAGTRGDNIEVLRSGSFHFNCHHEYVGVAPLCSKNTWYDCFETLERFVDMIAKESFTDPERLYLIGASMGGYATWQLAMSMPEYFAAIVPVCGGGMSWNAFRLVNVPIWAHHGAKDPTVAVEESERMVDAVNRSGGNAKLTVYPDVEHASWVPAYENSLVFDWLLEQKNKNVNELLDKFKGSEIYG